MSAIELVHRDPETGERGSAHVGRTLKDALVTTIAGPKGAVTMSIIFTIPLTMYDGTPFPSRDLIIFLTSGTILLTLVVANFALPLLAGQESAEDEERNLRMALIAVLDSTLKRLRAILKTDEHAEIVPALRLVTARYRSRLFRETYALEGYDELMDDLLGEVFKLQQKRADEIQSASIADGASVNDLVPYYMALRGIRRSVGYVGKGVNVGSQFTTFRGRVAVLWHGVFPRDVESEKSELVYYDTCLFAIDLERVAINYLEGVASENDGMRSEIAQVLANEHQSACESLWGRINFGQDVMQDPDRELVHSAHETMPENMRQTFGEQFKMARKHADEADALGLEIELEEIRRLRDDGKITKQQAHELRESVYLMQMSLGE